MRCENLEFKCVTINCFPDMKLHSTALKSTRISQLCELNKWKHKLINGLFTHPADMEEHNHSFRVMFLSSKKKKVRQTFTLLLTLLSKSKWNDSHNWKRCYLYIIPQLKHSHTSKNIQSWLQSTFFKSLRKEQLNSVTCSHTLTVKQYGV